MKSSTILCCVVLLITIITTSPARFPRQWVWPDEVNRILMTTSTTTTTTTSSPTTNSEEYQECIKNCPTTQEYNPICGSNNVTYDNPNKLKCAVFCGSDVRINFYRTCAVFGK